MQYWGRLRFSRAKSPRAFLYLTSAAIIKAEEACHCRSKRRKKGQNSRIRQNVCRHGQASFSALKSRVLHQLYDNPKDETPCQCLFCEVNPRPQRTESCNCSGYQPEPPAQDTTRVAPQKTMRNLPSNIMAAMVIHAFPWTEAEQLFHALSQCRACQTLEHISITSYDTDVQQPSGNSLTAVTHFLCFTQLCTLRLMLHHLIFLDNDLLLEAMSSWPHICSLELVDRQMHT
ncbi:uncharacterized protein EDB91DRAFT_191076 [Suillus paluster]|uniref:uncharacterized protein n=1 Tax=Suillus paluster TaxID=48578 RepID=UPI001B85FD50|nr:uncharacterized protein EDB91DRAFT_191076 [Suillus paluster]KAG1744565.1 hypothetical protein EDB91DRAFT_191076 [Suillus paluster]